MLPKEFKFDIKIIFLVYFLYIIVTVFLFVYLHRWCTGKQCCGTGTGTVGTVTSAKVGTVTVKNSYGSTTLQGRVS
jgi:hypothetical protein